MANMDIFNSDAFSMVQLTGALDKTDFIPSLLGDMGIFDFMPVRTESISIEKRDNVLALIPTSPRGAPPDEYNNAKRDIRNFNTVRIAKGDTVSAHEIQNIRAFGAESEFQQVQAEVQRRMGLVRNDVELTLENMRLGGVQGIVVDADGSTEIANWFTNWTITQATEINFALTTATTDVRALCAQVRRQMQRNAKGAWSPAVQIHGLCGDTFYDELIDHDQVRSTFNSWAAAADLRQDMVFKTFAYGGIFFHNYQGTDDNSTVAITTTEAKFFPVNAPGVFQVAHSPAETFDFVNTPGQEAYAMLITDKDRNAWVRVEEYSYPLHVCTRPEMLQRARNA